MRKIILFCVVQQLLYHVSRVESLTGHNIIPIRVGELPFIATFQLYPQELDFCRGALISKKHVITSALCLQYVSRENFRILFEVADGQDPIVAYTVASWTTYDDWVRTIETANSSMASSMASYIRRLLIAPPFVNPLYNLAIVQLTDKVYHVNPVQLSALTKRQVTGKTAIMTGRQHDVLSKATVKLLSDQDCESRIQMLVNTTTTFNDKVLCSAAEPFTLLDVGDLGSPLLHARDNTLLGIAYGFCPNNEHVLGNFSTEFIQQNQINVYYNIHFYRLFIHSVVPAIPAA